MISFYRGQLCLFYFILGAPSFIVVLLVEYFERLGFISPSEQRKYEVKSSGPGLFTLEKSGIEDESKVAVIYDPSFIVRLLRESGQPVCGIVAGKYRPELDRFGKTPINCIQSIDLKSDDFLLCMTLKIARKSPWWTSDTIKQLAVLSNYRKGSLLCDHVNLFRRLL
jgi:hypothetical protein